MFRSVHIALVLLLASNLVGIFAADEPSQKVADKPAVNLDELIARVVALGGSVQRDNQQPGNPIIAIHLGQADNLKEQDLKVIGLVSSLQFLNLNVAAVADDGLKHLTGLKNLTYLGLIGTNITDDGLKEIVGLQNLEELRVGNTAITDEGLKELAKLKNLKMVGLVGTPITDEGLKEFSKSLPNVRHNRGMVGNIRGPNGRLNQGSGQRADPDFDVSVAKPAYTEKHPSVLFDEAHQNFHTASGRYKAFADLMTNDGYRITPNTELITLKRLTGTNILVIANAMADPGGEKSAFTEAECDSIQNWVIAGGSLLLITDHEPFGSGSEELGKRFYIEMSLKVASDPENEAQRGLLFSRKKDLIGDHPIMTGRNDSERVNRILTFTGQSLNGPDSSVALLKFADTAMHASNNFEGSAAGYNQGLALNYGKGRVVVLGEAGQLSAQVIGNPPEPVGMNVPGCDNRIFALNIMHWLSGLID